MTDGVDGFDGPVSKGDSAHEVRIDGMVPNIDILQGIAYTDSNGRAVRINIPKQTTQGAE